MKKLFYPAIFQKEEKGFSISFPDIEGCLTQGDTMEECYSMAVDALGLSLSYLEDNNIQLPNASEPQNIKLKDNQFVVVIEFDMLAYKKRTNPKAVKKTLSIPEWLNEEAIAMNINFSHVLQDALLKLINK